jgi:hypothetical protein
VSPGDGGIAKMKFQWRDILTVQGGILRNQVLGQALHELHLVMKKAVTI